MKLKKSTKEWLDMFMKLHYLESREEAVYKLIEIYKSWNINLSNPSDNNDFKAQVGSETIGHKIKGLMDDLVAGKLKEPSPKPCPTCNGQKELPRMSEHGIGSWIKCWRCLGQGFIKS